MVRVNSNNPLVLGELVRAMLGVSDGYALRAVAIANLETSISIPAVG